MNWAGKASDATVAGIALVVSRCVGSAAFCARGQQGDNPTGAVTVHRATKFDVSPRLRTLSGSGATHYLWNET